MGGTMKDGDWLSIYTIYDIVEASAIEALLKDNSISVEVYYRSSPEVLRILDPVRGRGEIRVPKADAGKAKELIEIFKRMNA